MGDYSAQAGPQSLGRGVGWGGGVGCGRGAGVGVGVGVAVGVDVERHCLLVFTCMTLELGLVPLPL